VAEDVIRARRIELLDDEGNVSVVLEGEAEGRAGLLISTPEAGAPTITIGIDRASGNPFIFMYSGGKASIFATFEAVSPTSSTIATPRARPTTRSSKAAPITTSSVAMAGRR
jgi:hypothetical protein